MQNYLKKCFVGFSYGASFPLTLVVLDYWLKDIGASNATIGLFTLLHSTFVLKFIWGVFIENYDIPYFSKKFGHTKGWIIASHLALIFGVISMAFSRPENGFACIIFSASVVAIADGCKNIVLYPYQVQDTSDKNIGYSANAVGLGHRIGTIAIKVLTLQVAYFFNWTCAYLSAAVLLSIVTIFTLYMNVPKVDYTHRGSWRLNFIDSCQEVISYGKAVIWVLVMYKGADFMMQKMSRAFCIEIGFSKLEIANIVQFFGSVAVVAGGFICGYVIKQIGLLKTMKFVWIAHMFSFLSYLLLIKYGADTRILTGVIFLEGITGGSVTAAFLAFLYKVCKKESQYAILWGMHEASGLIFMTLSGFLVDAVGWKYYFLIIPIIFSPTLLLFQLNGKSSLGYTS